MRLQFGDRMEAVSIFVDLSPLAMVVVAWAFVKAARWERRDMDLREARKRGIA